MKKDIQKIPSVEGVYIAIIYDYNKVFKTNDWNVYLINDKDITIEMVLIVSHGFDREINTSTMRHKLESLPAKSGAKIELMQDEVLKLNNEFKLTFFADNTLYEKTFLFKKNTIKESALRTIKILDNKKGIIVK
jgi:hypothetical protein